jgi:hypothetical protein
MTRLLTVVVVPALAERFARQVSEVVLLRAVVWPIAVVLLRAAAIAVVLWPIAVVPIVAGTILIAERRSVPQQ